MLIVGVEFVMEHYPYFIFFLSQFWIHEIHGTKALAVAHAEAFLPPL